MIILLPTLIETWKVQLRIETCTRKLRGHDKNKVYWGLKYLTFSMSVEPLHHALFGKVVHIM